MEQPKPTQDSEEINLNYTTAEGIIKYYSDLMINPFTARSDKDFFKQRVQKWNEQLTKLLKE